jgi:DNA-directed RNA polymerase III subunit RPC2
MERDVYLALGVSGFIKDRMMEQSDEVTALFCRMCGLYLYRAVGPNISGAVIECRVCGSLKYSEIKIPYATKLMMQETMGMNVVARVLALSFHPQSQVIIVAGKKPIGKGVVMS